MDTPEAPARSQMDRDLLRRYRAGDVDAFMELYRRYSRPLLAYARSEDLVQEAFVRLMEADPDALGPSVKPYLYAVVRNLAADQARREKVRREKTPGPAAPRGPAAGEDVSEALSVLPEEQREVVVLKVFGGLTLTEVAEVMSTSEATATSRWRYALEKLARVLGGKGERP